MVLLLIDKRQDSVESDIHVVCTVCSHSIQKDSERITFEPPHDKTNKMSVRPAKTQISLGIRPVCLSADAQADQSLRWAHNHIVGFVMRRLI